MGLTEYELMTKIFDKSQNVRTRKHLKKIFFNLILQMRKEGEEADSGEKETT